VLLLLLQIWFQGSPAGVAVGNNVVPASLTVPGCMLLLLLPPPPSQILPFYSHLHVL
jgi:hypothetical protein